MYLSLPPSLGERLVMLEGETQLNGDLQDWVSDLESRVARLEGVIAAAANEWEDGEDFESEDEEVEDILEAEVEDDDGKPVE